MLAAKPGERVLDAGCGSGAAMVEVLRLARCLLSGIDASTAMLAIARRRLGDAVELRQARIEAMPFGDACFDAALALNVLYFCDPQHAMIASLHRVLRPGGRLVVYVTHRRTMERWSFARRGLHRLFDEESLIRALTAGGFDPLRIRVHSKPIAPSVTGLLAVARR
jgi:ubiquinone/menaquinone biosynthesis C-methylase UbiE